MVTLHKPVPCWGVYRVLKSGAHKYVSRTATTSEKLAMEIASDLSIGRIVRPDGSELWVPAHPHVHQLIPNALVADTPAQQAETIRPKPDQSARDQRKLDRLPRAPKGWDQIEPGPEQSFAPRGAEAAALASVEGMETTDEERARWSKNLADEGRGTTLTNETCLRLLRDFARLQAEAARLTAGLQEIAAMQWDAPAEIARALLSKTGDRAHD